MYVYSAISNKRSMTVSVSPAHFMGPSFLYCSLITAFPLCLLTTEMVILRQSLFLRKPRLVAKVGSEGEESTTVRQRALH